MNYSQTEVQNQIDWLKDILKPGDTVYTILRHTSQSGMTRYIGLVVIRDGHPLHPNYAANVLLGKSYKHKYDGVKMTGCGMDMGFELVYNLGRILYPAGFKDGNSHQPDGGYAFRHEWL